jgi:hypothetical protein
MLRYHLFGHPRLIDVHARREVWITARQHHLLLTLALAGPRGLTRDRVIFLLWPDADHATGRNRLKQLVFQTRRNGPHVLQALPAGRISLGPVVSCDWWDYQDARVALDATRMRELATAPLLDELPLGVTVELEQWTDMVRASVARTIGEAA